MLKRVALLALALSTVLLPVGASAGEVGGKEGFVAAGVGLPMGDFGDAAKLGFGLTAGAGYNVTEQLVVGVAVDFSRHSFKVPEGGADAGVEVDGSSTLLGGGVYARYLLAPEGSQPYLLARFGLTNFKASGDVLVDGDVYESVDESETKPALAVGAGIDFPAGESSKGFVEGTFNVGFTSETKTTWIGVRAGIRFGK